MKQCPRRYWFAYIQKHPVPTPIHLVFGSAVHRALEWLYKGDPRQRLERVQKGRPQFFFRSVQSFTNFWQGFLWPEFTRPDGDPSILGGQPFQEIEYSSGDPEEIKSEWHQLKNFGSILLANYYLHHQDAPWPVQVEKSFSVPLGVFRSSLQGVTLTGMIDQIRPDEEGRYMVVDFKTGRTFFSVEDARKQLPLHKGLQFSLYSLAFRFEYETEEQCLLWYPLNYKRGEQGKPNFWEPVPTWRDEQDHAEALDEIESFLDKLAQERFPRTDDYRRCRFCPYFDPCWGKEAYAAQPIRPEDLPRTSRQEQVSQLQEAVQDQDPKVRQPQLKFGKKSENSSSGKQEGVKRVTMAGTPRIEIRAGLVHKFTKRRPMGRDQEGRLERGYKRENGRFYQYSGGQWQQCRLRDFPEDVAALFRKKHHLYRYIGRHFPEALVYVAEGTHSQ